MVGGCLLSALFVVGAAAFTYSSQSPYLSFKEGRKSSFRQNRPLAWTDRGSFNGRLSALGMSQVAVSEGGVVPLTVTWPTRNYNTMTDSYQWGSLSSAQVFSGKRVIVFSLPGAFTPTCSSTHLPRFEALYDDLRALGIDEVYCMSVNDPFVMNAWGKERGVSKVKLIPDGNGEFTKQIGMLVSKANIGFGDRSWRYAMVVNDGVIEKLFCETDKRDLADDDAFDVSDADSVMGYLKTIPRAS